MTGIALTSVDDIDLANKNLKRAINTIVSNAPEEERSKLTMVYNNADRDLLRAAKLAFTLGKQP